MGKDRRFLVVIKLMKGPVWTWNALLLSNLNKPVSIVDVFNNTLIDSSTPVLWPPGLSFHLAHKTMGHRCPILRCAHPQILLTFICCVYLIENPKQVRSGVIIKRMVCPWNALSQLNVISHYDGNIFRSLKFTPVNSAPVSPQIVSL